jgi:8-oxo-dGTP pyrophosphatase MutT (NUDIX family)
MIREKLGCRGFSGPFPAWDDFPESGFRRSAVLVLLWGEPEYLRNILIRMPKHLNRHAGEIAFPGGKREPGDRGPVETALREAREELGVDPQSVFPCRLLEKEYAYSSDFEILPVLALSGSTEPPRVLIDGNEVEEVFSLPVTDCLRPTRLEWSRHGSVEFLFPVFEPSADCRIWGATARILWQLGRILAPVLGMNACQ